MLDSDFDSRGFARSLLSSAALLACAQVATAQPQPTANPAPAAGAASAAGTQAAPQQLPTVQIQGNYIISSDAASQGAVTSKLIASRPTLRPAGADTGLVWSRSAFAASPSFAGSYQVPTHTTLVVIFGFTERAPRV